MYLIVEYSPVSLFSLKQSNATDKAAKSLPSPSPYSVKMALLYNIISKTSIDNAKKHFKLIRDLNIRFDIGDRFVINNFLVKIRYVKSEEQKPTPSFREYVYHHDNLKIAVNISDLQQDKIEFLQKWFMVINYFGKRGCFFQYKGSSVETKLGKGYSNVVEEPPIEKGIIVPLDEVEQNAKFKHMNNCAKGYIAKRKEQLHFFPFERFQSSRNFTAYRKV